ncbi:MAG: hypothetical protein JXN64_15560 [Spirochaetes bacterium]|nr:hypothetical protein [Spirochaetota bacterium]
MEKFLKLILFAACCIFPSALTARDINLDEIYIKKTSAFHKKLALEKLETYQIVDAVFVDRDVIFAVWITGNELIYIKESDSLRTNYIYKFRLRDRKIVELCKVNGVITIARVTHSGRYLVTKRLTQGNGIIPRGETVVVDLTSGKLKTLSSAYAFLDFTVPCEGSSIIMEKGNGIVELSLETNIQRSLIGKNKYKDIIISSTPSMGYLSPDKQKILLLNGSGGNYKAKISGYGSNQIPVKGISSSSEIFWLDNFTFVYRTGYAGNFAVVLRTIRDNKTTTLLRSSYNTNINYSIHSGIISFLKEQIIFYYKRSENNILNTGLEGEDVSFAPNGSFISILYKKLFIVKSGILQKRHIELKRSWKSIFQMYKAVYNKKDEFENEHSQLFIGRKVELYGKLCGF